MSIAYVGLRSDGDGHEVVSEAEFNKLGQVLWRR